MRLRPIALLALCVATYCATAEADDYYSRQARSYTREAEYYQRQAAGHRRDADYYLKKAEGYQREASYYTRRGDASRARDYNRRAESAMSDYRTRMQRAARSDDKAADYLKRAQQALRKAK